MDADGVAPEQPDELDQLEDAIARETEAIAQLEHRTRVLRVEIAGWKPPPSRRGGGYGFAGFLLGGITVVTIGALIAFTFFLIARPV